MPAPAIYLCAALLFLAAAPLPYGYYTLLRLVACGVFAFAAFIAYERKHALLPWIYGLLAVAFNPIIKIYLPKEVWIFLDIGAGYCFSPRQKQYKRSSFALLFQLA